MTTPDCTPTMPAQKTGTDSPITTVNACAMGNGHPQGFQAVGDVLSDAELVQHVQDCGRHMLAHYERFELLGDPADREAALMWMFMQQQAQAALSPSAKAAREAEIQRRIDDGVGFFAARGEADRLAVQGRCA